MTIIKFCLEESSVNLGKGLALVQSVENILSEGGIEFAKPKLLEVLSKNPWIISNKKNSRIISGEISNNNEKPPGVKYFKIVFS